MTKNNVAKSIMYTHINCIPKRYKQNCGWNSGDNTNGYE